MKVFISWSGDRSRVIASAWEQLLKEVLQKCTPFMSQSGIESGDKWFDVLSEQLQSTNFGIFCLTPENRNARWILFEAGAVSKHVEKARICPYLFDMGTSDLEFPLQAFNASLANRDGTFDIIESINNGLKGRKRSESELAKSFERWWPDFDAELQRAKKVDVQHPDRRSDRSMLHELVDLARVTAQNTSRLPPSDYRLPPGFADPFVELRVTFIDGPRNGESIKGNVNQSPFSIIYIFTEGEIGGIWNATSDLSRAMLGNMTHAALRRLIDEVPDAYGFQAYQVIERSANGAELHLKMKYVPHDKGKEANEFKKRMKEEREQKNRDVAGAAGP